MLALARRPSIARMPWHLADIDFDFMRQTYRQGRSVSNNPASFMNLTRASSAYVDNAAGLWTSFASGAFRITDKGLFVEGSRSSIAKWVRDLTNVLWVKTNVTAALDQAGIDGGANLASSLTATANNGTVLQAITSASAVRCVSAWVKRLVGSGIVSMTVDGGATWTDITAQLGNATTWRRASIPLQTLANPSLGFRFAASGDKIAVDFCQLENAVLAGAGPSSPILVTTSNVTRAADVITVPVLPNLVEPISLYGRIIPSDAGLNTGSLYFTLSDGTQNNRINLTRGVGRLATVSMINAVGGSSAPPATTIWEEGREGAISASFASNSVEAAWDGEFFTAYVAAIPPVPTQINIGTAGPLSNPLYGFIRRLGLWSGRRFSLAQHKAAVQHDN